MNNQAVFCTSLVDNNKDRYQKWIDYYTEFFDGCGVDLWMVNDGPVNLPLGLKGVTLKTFDVKLGRESIWIFPGWKRSFYHALLWLKDKYQYISHVESDCWISKAGKKDFLYYLKQDGYFTGYTPTYNFPEASLQIINSHGVRQYLLDKYSCVENWYENIDFELDLSRLNPVYILNGDRIENDISKMKPEFTFVAGATYEEFLRHYG